MLCNFYFLAFPASPAQVRGRIGFLCSQCRSVNVAIHFILISHRFHGVHALPFGFMELS